jgi:hypothetical protein
LEEILSALRYRRDEAVTAGFEVSDSYVTLGLSRAALEWTPDSELLGKIDEVERYFLQHFVRNRGNQTGGQACDLRFCHPLASNHPNANINSTLVKIVVVKTQDGDAKSLQ